MRATSSADLGEGRGGEGKEGGSGRPYVAEGRTICPEEEGRKVDGRVRVRGGAAACKGSVSGLPVLSMQSHGYVAAS